MAPGRARRFALLLSRGNEQWRSRPVLPPLIAPPGNRRRRRGRRSSTGGRLARPGTLIGCSSGQILGPPVLHEAARGRGRVRRIRPADPGLRLAAGKEVDPGRLRRPSALRRTWASHREGRRRRHLPVRRDRAGTPGVRLHHLLDDPVYVLATRRERGMAALRDATWIAGCDRCRSHLLSICADAGFKPRIGYSSDDMVVMQALVAAGLGVATQTGLSLRAHHVEGVVATELPGW